MGPEFKIADILSSFPFCCFSLCYSNPVDSLFHLSVEEYTGPSSGTISDHIFSYGSKTLDVPDPLKCPWALPPTKFEKLTVYGSVPKPILTRFFLLSTRLSFVRVLVFLPGQETLIYLPRHPPGVGELPCVGGGIPLVPAVDSARPAHLFV